MDNDLLEQQATSLLKMTSPIDGDGLPFEFGKTYFYFNALTVAIDSIVPEYHALAIAPAHYYDLETDKWVYQHQRKHSEPLKISTRMLFNSVEKPLEIARVAIEKMKNRHLLDMRNFIAGRSAKMGELDTMLNDLESKHCMKK